MHPVLDPRKKQVRAKHTEVVECVCAYTAVLHGDAIWPGCRASITRVPHLPLTGISHLNVAELGIPRPATLPVSLWNSLFPPAQSRICVMHGARLQAWSLTSHLSSTLSFLACLIVSCNASLQPTRLWALALPAPLRDKKEPPRMLPSALV